METMGVMALILAIIPIIMCAYIWNTIIKLNEFLTNQNKDYKLNNPASADAILEEANKFIRKK